MSSKPWDEDWDDIKRLARESMPTGIRALCKENPNGILEVGDDRIIVRSQTGPKPRELKSEDFKYV